MTSPRGTRRRNPSRTADPPRAVEKEPKPRTSGTAILGVFRGLVITFLLLLLKGWFEVTPVGERLKSDTYDLLQERLSSAISKEDLPVIVVDISESDALKAKTTDGSEAVTPREPLIKLITAIAKQKPRAIGVDVDFSPDPDRHLPRTDPEFFASCLRLRSVTNVPIFLGIFRSQALLPEEWLGSRDYEPLAASIVIPTDAKKMAWWIQVDGDRSRTLPTLSAALADASHKSDWQPPRPVRWLLVSLVEKKLASTVKVAEFLIDYSPLEVLVKDKTRLKDLVKQPEVAPELHEHLTDKIVLIGNATLGKTSDTFVVPNQSSPIAGVYVHACAAYTLIKGPLYEWRPMIRLALDILLSALVFGIVIGVREYYRLRTDRVVAARRLSVALALLIVFVVILVAVLLVPRTRIMWDDFFLVIVVVLVHPSVEHRAGKLWTWLQNGRRFVWRKLFLSDKKGNFE
jgi:CHASE2 domain-containing sensor protein